MLTHSSNADPLRHHFYIVKLGCTGVYIFFLFLVLNIDRRYSLVPPHEPHEAVLTCTHDLCFRPKNKNIYIYFLM